MNRSAQQGQETLLPLDVHWIPNIFPRNIGFFCYNYL